VADVLRQASDGFPVVRFVLNAVEPRENKLNGLRSANVRGKASDGVEAGRCRVFVHMGQSDFHAIGETGERDFQLRMSRAQMLERFRARGDDGGLQSGGSVVLEPGGIGEKAPNTSCCGRQTGVSVKKEAECFGFSAHGCWPEKRRRLPGNQGNSRGRRSKGARSPVPCRWCNIFRRSSDLPASRIARKGFDLA
jgi:hypothetical protein